MRVIDSVQRERLGRFIGKIAHVRGFRLHPVGKLVGRDPPLEIGLPRSPGEMPPIEGLGEIERRALHRRKSRRWLEIGKRLTIVAEACPLIRRRQKRIRPVRAPAEAPHLEEHDVAGKIGVLASQAVRQPAPQARLPPEDRASVHLVGSGGVVGRVAVHRPHDAQPIGMLGRQRHPVRDPQPALAVLPPRPGGTEERILAVVDDASDLVRDPLDRVRNRLPGERLEERLAVEQIDLTRAAVLVKHDQVFRLPGSVRWPGCEGAQRIDRRGHSIPQRLTASAL